MDTTRLKIERCIALARSDNEHEAELALERARSLMRQYGVEPDDLSVGAQALLRERPFPLKARSAAVIDFAKRSGVSARERAARLWRKR
ncbi:MAG: DUF2786 domain-containing protein [Sphingomonadaceae bacterium]|nr:DUF2786 domain-containing protein [Sphingomonadaceae bacterium]